MNTIEHRRILDTYGEIRINTYSSRLCRAFIFGHTKGCDGPNEENAIEGLYEYVNELMYFEMLDILDPHSY